MNKIRVIHLITGLNTGGAEMMLYKLLSKYDQKRFLMSVISLTDVGPVGEKIQGLGVQVHSLGMRKNPLCLLKFIKLIRLLRQQKPDILQTWMYHADFVGALAKLFIKNIKLVWNIRQGYIETGLLTKRLTVYIAKFCAILSRSFPNKVICCAKSTADFHTDLGYCAEKMLVIHNGFDCNVFRPCQSELRDELGLSEQDIVIGMVGRFHPNKDYFSFVDTAQLLAKKKNNIYFVCCGQNIDKENIKLWNRIEIAGLDNLFYLLGERHDIPNVLSGFNTLLSASLAEGFSNVIAEAMACGVPCVVTNVGDSADIVVNKDYVVPAANPEALANAVMKILSMSTIESKKIGELGRNRIKENYSLEKIVNQYQELYAKIIR